MIGARHFFVTLAAPLWLVPVLASATEATQAPAPTSSAPTPSLATLRPLMREMLAELTALQPSLVNRLRYESQDHQKEISRRLQHLAEISAKVMLQKTLNSPSYRISGATLHQQILNANNLFKAGRKNYSRWALESVPTACATCHTQGTSNPSPLWTTDPTQIEGTPTERAEFLLATRNYQAAEVLFTTAVRSFAGQQGRPGPEQDAEILENALKKKLLIWVRVWRDPAGARKSLELDLKNAQLPPSTRSLVKHWIGQIAKLSPARDSRLHGEKLLNLARKHFPGERGLFLTGLNPNLVRQLWISGLLYQEVNEKADKKLMPEFLYWLAIADFELNGEANFSLGNMYLRDCILAYPRTSITPLCYRELELQMDLMYNGARGMDVPSEVQEDLRRLKGIVDAL